MYINISYSSEGYQDIETNFTSTNLSDEFSAMSEYLTGCFILVNKILRSEDESKFIELLKKYNSLAEFLFDMMISFQRKLINHKIIIEDMKYQNKA